MPVSVLFCCTIKPLMLIILKPLCNITINKPLWHIAQNLADCVQFAKYFNQWNNFFLCLVHSVGAYVDFKSI